MQMVYSKKIGKIDVSNQIKKNPTGEKGMQETYKIIFSDIDGTLLSTNYHILPRTREKILELDKKGIPFILVSARMPEGIYLVQQELGNHQPIICYSGGLILDKDKNILYSSQIDLDLAEEIQNSLKENCPKICPNIYGGNQWLVEDDQNPWVMREERIVHGKAQTGEIKSVFAKDGGIHKFLLMGEPEEITRAENFLRPRYKHLSILKSTPYYLEVMHEDAKKSKGVCFLCDYYGVSADEAVAFGDGENDVDMLLAVKYGIAMANAADSIKKQAAFVTLSNDEEGIFAALDQWK